MIRRFILLGVQLFVFQKGIILKKRGKISEPDMINF